MGKSLRVLVLLGLLAVALGQSAQSGQILEQAGQMEQAFNEFRLALNANPADAAAFQGLVRLSRTLGRSDTLAAVSRRLAQARPGQGEYAVGLAEALFGLKQRAQAVAELRRAAKQWPAQVPQLADVAAQWQEYDEAIRLYLQAREQVGQDLLYSERLVDLYERQGQRIAAAREVVRILNRQSEALGIYAQKLSAYAGKTDTRALQSELEKIAAPRVRAQAQATVYLALGRDAEAVRLLKAGLSDQELYRFAHELEAQENLRPALLIYRQQRAHADAARVLRRLGRAREAQAELAQDTGVGAQFELAELLLEQREFAAAIEAYEKVLKRQPGHEPALLGLAAAQLGSGDMSRARSTVRRIGRPNDRALLLLAEAFFYEGRFDSAQAQVQALLEQYPQSPLVNDGLELAVLVTGAAKDDTTTLRELARAMLSFETGADEAGAEQAAALAKGSGPVAEQATLLRARFLVRAGKPKEALPLLEGFAQRFPKSPLRPRAKLDLARLYREALKDDSKYRETLEALILEYPGSPYVPVARSLLVELNAPVAPSEVH